MRRGGPAQIPCDKPMVNKAVICALMLLASAGTALAAEEEAKVKIETLVPAFIPPGRPALEELTAGLRAKVKTLKLNGLPAPKKGKVSRALLLLPRDRAGAGVLNFEIEGGKRAGIYQCEALGRGRTSAEPEPDWAAGLLGGATLYYAPERLSGGATVPGVYDLRNIAPENYEITFLDKPEDLLGEEAVVARTRSKKAGVKPFYSAVWKYWYPKASAATPVDMTWAEDSQAGSQGAGVPVFVRQPYFLSPESLALRAKQLAHNPGYYSGPYGRYGFAVHTDRWEDPAAREDPEKASRPELLDFRYRDTDGCVKLRPACLELLNEFVAGEEKLGRRVQLEVFETPLLDGLPAAPAP